jgi:membrane protease subunit (stomatin/prohibitin family)
MAIQVLEWKDDTGREMVHRFEPGGELKLGAQLVVLENQWAVFFRDGRALDTFGTGRHTLTTANIPLLGRLIGAPFGGTSPFRADAYFVSRKVFTDLKWGTKDPVAFRDRELSMVRLRAHGVFAVRVGMAQIFVNQIVGSMGRYTVEDIESYLRDLIVARLNDVLGETLKTLFDLPERYDELAEALKGRVVLDFAKYGLELADFFINAITPPEDVQKVIDDRAGMAAAGDPGAYLRFKAARAMGDAASSQAGGGAAGTAAAGMGLGVGAGLGMMIPGMLALGVRGDAEAATAAATAVAAARICGACRAACPTEARFCASCGAKLAANFCAECGSTLPSAAKFCPGCGAKQ